MNQKNFCILKQYEEFYMLALLNGLINKKKFKLASNKNPTS